MTNPHDKAIEAGAKEMCAAGCEKVPGAIDYHEMDAEEQAIILSIFRRVIAAYERAMWGEPVAWRYKSEAPGGHSKWSVTQSRADLDTLRKMPFMRVEPIYVLPPVPEGE